MNLFWGCLGPYDSRIFTHQSTRQSDLSTIFVLRLSALPFTGLAAMRLLLLYYLPALWRGWLLHYLVSLALQDIFQAPWIFACFVFSAVSYLDNLEESALGGSLEVFCLSELLAFHRPITSGISALVTGIFFVSCCLSGFCRDILFPCYLFIAGILQSYPMDFLVTERNVSGILVPDFCYHCFVMKNISRDFLPCSWTAYFTSVIIVLWWRKSHGIFFLALGRPILSAVFPHFLWWGEINIDVME